MLHEDGSVDSKGTESLRNEMRDQSSREKEREIFDRGGSWEELRANCLEETGLAAPIPPWEINLRGPMTQLPWFQEWKEKHAHHAERQRAQ